MKTLYEIAVEFNVGVNTLKDFLHSEGYYENYKHGSIINEELYLIIDNRFNFDKLIKIKSKDVVLSEIPVRNSSKEEKQDDDEQYNEPRRRFVDQEAAIMGALRRGDAEMFGF